MSVEEYLKDWIELSAKRKVKETTLKNYIRAIEHRIIPSLGKNFFAKVIGCAMSKVY
jgi:hypothetical protein